MHACKQRGISVIYYLKIFYKMASESGRRLPSAKNKRTSHLLNKEEEFIRLNAELEEKTASLINEAEIVLRGQEKILDGKNKESNQSAVLPEKRVQGRPQSAPKSKPGIAKTKKADIPTRLASSQSNITKARKQLSKQGSQSSIQATFLSDDARDDGNDGVIVDDHVSMNLLQDRIHLANKISVLEQEMADEYYTPSRMNEDVIPDVANEMNPDAIIRFLKAKLRVMQEEMDRVSNENSELVNQIKSSDAKIKDLTEDQQQAQKTKGNLQNQVEKWKKLYEESKQKITESEQQISQLKKEIDSFKREKKQMSATLNTLEVRMNRALEEAERNKSLLNKAKESTKDISEQERKRMEHLTSDNKRLERQKNELMNAFKKQMKLIDILKRQKMHIEAAKMLQFTEEEFVKALDWGT